MKTKRISVVFVTVLLFCTFPIAVSALQPPNVHAAPDMAGLPELIEKINSNFTGASVGRHIPPFVFGEDPMTLEHNVDQRATGELRLEHRRVLIPSIADSNFEKGSISFIEGAGDAIAFSSFSFNKHISLFENVSIVIDIFYDSVNPLVGYRLITLDLTNRENIISVYEGVHNGNPFYGYSFLSRAHGVNSIYQIVVGDAIVRIQQNRPFCESHLDLVSIDETGFLIPVYLRVIPAPVSSWAIAQVEEAIAQGLVPEQLLYDPFRLCQTLPASRAEFAALAVRLYETVNSEIMGRKSFADTNSVDVEKLAYLGVVSGIGNNLFNPSGTITREQAAVILSRLSDVMGHTLPIYTATFTDFNEISVWALESVGAVQAAEIVGGVGDNIFAPQQSFTREQSIITILRLYNMVDNPL
jgi:hypothetical protein